MGWSISPSSSIARIDSNSGQATFGHHDNDKTYTITYTDEEKGTLSHQFTVYACAPPQPTGTCNSETHRLGYCVRQEGGNHVQIGTYDSMDWCSGTWTTKGTLPSWISNVTFENGKIYANVSSNGDTERTERITTYLSDIGDGHFDVTQCGGGGGGCNCSSASFAVTGKTLDGSGQYSVEVATYTADCEDNASVGFVSGDNFLEAPFLNSGSVMAKVSPYEGYRTGVYGIYIDGNECTTFTVIQNGAGGCNCAAVHIDSEVTFESSGGTSVVGGISSGCELIVQGASDWCRLYQDGTDVRVSANTNTNANSRHYGFGYKVGDSNCGDIAVHQSGSGTIYNILIKGSYEKRSSDVLFSIVYEQSGGPHAPTITNGKMSVEYKTCANTYESPILDDGATIALCEPGSGSEYSIDRVDTYVKIYSITCTVTLIGGTKVMSSGETYDFTYPGSDITYHVTCL